ncbi:hypothetical protein GQ568_01505 [Patescibacteria group bacterium]|nr:hypothetical protein [Patescibacteria group bacterium]
MKTTKIGIAGASLLMLAIFVLPCVAFGNQQSVSEKKDAGTAQEKNAEPVQNQGEDQKIQSQEIELVEAGQNIDSGDNNNNNSGNNKGENENETGAKQTIGIGSKDSSENGQKVQNQINQNQENQGEQRRSRVANAVQEMLAVAERNPGIGQQVRTIAQNQNQEQEEMEDALEVTKKRSGVVKFLIGPNYKELKKVENRLENHKNRLEELKGLRAQLENSADAEVLTQQIQIMEQIGAELENEVNEEKQGISLFGWLFRWMAK